MLQVPSTNEDDITQLKKVGFDPNDERFEFEKGNFEKGKCMGFGDGTTSQATTAAPEDGCESLGMSTRDSMLSYRTEGLASTGLSRDVGSDPQAFAKVSIEERTTEFGTVMATATDNFASEGSKKHGTGNCKPCAWFHKPGSCQNGKDCLHCHVCPPGEIKSRKKARSGATQARPGKTEFVKISTDLGEDSTPTAEAKVNAQQLRDENGAAVTPDKVPILTSADVTTVGEILDKLVASPPPGLDPPPERDLPSGPSESVGSELHAKGECKPCAWYWKPGSCHNGKDCMHCHLCLESELKKRKKAKLQNLRGVSADPPETAATTEVQQSYRRSSRSPGRKENRGTRTTRSTSPLHPAALHLTPFQVVEPVIDINDENVQANLPSIGSALHAMGKCKPCAWHWKPGGCTNGKECCHCHLCPSGELKGRRKAKESAMRVGALMPTKIQQRRAPSHTRASMHVLKLYPLLGKEF
jgi:hypothetical protein